MIPRTLAAVAILASAGVTAAQAAPIYATGFNDVVAGADQAADRADPAFALGATDGRMYELGTNGSVDFTFGQLFTGPAALVEITFGNRARYDEDFKVFGVLEGIATLIGSFHNDDVGLHNVLNVAFDGIYDELRFVDFSVTDPDRGQRVSGVDIDSVSVSPVPLPAAGFLLACALGALGLARRHTT